MGDILITLPIDAGGTPVIATTVAEVTNQAIAEAYLDRVTALKDILDSLNTMVENQTATPALAGANGANLEDIVYGPVGLLALAQFGAVGTNGQTYYLTTDMAKQIDALVRSLAAAGITGSGTATGEALLQWQSLAATNVNDIVAKAVRAADNRSLQAMVELDYVINGTNLVETQMNNLYKALSATQDATDQLTQLQSIHNLIAPIPVDTSAATLFSDPTKLVPIAQEALFSLLTDGEKAALGITQASEITQDMYDNYGTWQLNGTNNFENWNPLLNYADSSITGVKPFGVYATLLQALTRPEFADVRNDPLYAITPQKLADVGIPVEPDFWSPIGRAMMARALIGMRDFYRFNPTGTTFLGTNITFDPFTMWGLTLIPPSISPDYAEMNFLVNNLTNLTESQWNSTWTDVQTIPPYSIDLSLRSLFAFWMAHDPGAVSNYGLQNIALNPSGTDIPVPMIDSNPATGGNPLLNLDFGTGVSPTTAQRQLQDAVYALLPPSKWQLIGIMQATDITNTSFDVNTIQKGSVVLQNNTVYNSAYDSISHTLLKRYFDPLAQEDNPPPLTAAQLIAVGLSPEPDFSLFGERKRIFDLATKYGIALPITSPEGYGATGEAQWRTLWSTSLRTAFSNLPNDPPDNLRDAAFAELEISGTFTGAAGNTLAFANPITGPQRQQAIFDLLTPDERLQLGITQPAQITDKAWTADPDVANNNSLTLNHLYANFSSTNGSTHYSLKSILIKKYQEGELTAAQLNSAQVSTVPLYYLGYTSDMFVYNNLFTADQKQQFNFPPNPWDFTTFGRQGLAAWRTTTIAYPGLGSNQLSAAQKREVGQLTVLVDPLLDPNDTAKLDAIRTKANWAKLSEELFGKPLDPMVDYKDRNPQDVLRDILQIRQRLAEILGILDQITPPGPAGRTPNSLADTIAKVLQDIHDNIGDDPDFNDIDSLSGAISGLELWIIDNMDQHSGTGTSTSQLSNSAGNIQANLTQAITAASHLNDQQKEDFQRFTTIYEEFMKSASNILRAITDMIQKMAQNAGR